MKYQSFCMRVLCLLLILASVIGYNSMQKKIHRNRKLRRSHSYRNVWIHLKNSKKKCLPLLKKQPKSETAKAQAETDTKTMQSKKARQTVKMQKVRMIPRISTRTVLIPVLHRDSAVRSRFR